MSHQTKESFSSCCQSPLNGIWQIPSRLSYSFFSKWHSSNHSPIKAWLMECSWDDCPFSRSFHHCRRLLDLCEIERWILGHRGPTLFGPIDDRRKSNPCPVSSVCYGGVGRPRGIQCFTRQTRCTWPYFWSAAAKCLNIFCNHCAYIFIKVRKLLYWRLGNLWWTDKKNQWLWENSSNTTKQNKTSVRCRPFNESP